MTGTVLGSLLAAAMISWVVSRSLAPMGASAPPWARHVERAWPLCLASVAAGVWIGRTWPGEAGRLIAAGLALGVPLLLAVAQFAVGLRYGQRQPR